MKKANFFLIHSGYTQGPGRTTAKGTSVVIHSTLVAETGDMEFLVTEMFDLGSIKTVIHKT